MPKQTIVTLKGKFETGKTPAQQDYHDVLDSYVHKDDQSEINTSTVNAAITAYDTALKAQSSDGVVNSLGDVFKVLLGYSDTRKIHDELKWSGLPGRPNSLNLVWTEQVIDFFALTSFIPTFDPLLSSGETMPSYFRTFDSLRISAGGAAGLKIQVLDLYFLRRRVTIGGSSFVIHELQGALIGVSPKVNLV